MIHSATSGPYQTDDQFMQAFAPTLPYDTFITLYGPEYIKRLSTETQEQFMAEIVATIFQNQKRINYADDLRKFSCLFTDLKKIVRAQYAKTPIPELVEPLASKGVLFLDPSELNVEDSHTYDDFKKRYGFEYFKDLPPPVRTRFIQEIAESIFKNPQGVEQYVHELWNYPTRTHLKNELLVRCAKTSLLVLQKAIPLFQRRIIFPEDNIPSSGSLRECFERVVADYPTLDLFAKTYGRGFYTSGFVAQAHAIKILAPHFILNAVSVVSVLADKSVDPELPQVVREPLEEARKSVIEVWDYGRITVLHNLFEKIKAGKGTFQDIKDQIHDCEEPIIATFVTQMNQVLARS